MRLREYIVLFLTVVSVVASWRAEAVVQPQQRNAGKIQTVVIDAGHGGKDPGATCRGLREKDINLSVALRLGRLIEESYPDVKVIYTRKTDVFVDLFKRGDIANRASADLFISIHVNAAVSPSATGNEVLVMGADKAGKNLDIAMRENDVVVYEDDYKTKYEGYQPGSSESYIMFSLMQYSYQSQSIDLARMVTQEFSQRSGRPNRGVKQAPILVLWRTAMPSILTEFGFISNVSDNRLLSSGDGQDMYALSIFNAFSRYKASVEGGKALVRESLRPEPDTLQQPIVAADDDTKSPASDECNSNIIYKVQIGSCATHLNLNSGKYRKYADQISETKSGRTYKYTVGGCSSYKEALSLLRKMQSVFQDAFIVAFDEGVPMDVVKARSITEK